jgi:hypothetical protein
MSFDIVIPAKAGTHGRAARCGAMGPGFRRDDEVEGFDTVGSLRGKDRK